MIDEVFYDTEIKSIREMTSKVLSSWPKEFFIWKQEIHPNGSIIIECRDNNILGKIDSITRICNIGSGGWLVTIRAKNVEIEETIYELIKSIVKIESYPKSERWLTMPYEYEIREILQPETIERDYVDGKVILKTPSVKVTIENA